MNNYENMKSAVRSSRHRTIVKKQEDYRRYVTLKNGRKAAEVVRRIPIEFLLSETDAPYMAPEPLRGRPNKPQYVEHVVRRMAMIKGISYGEAARILTENGKRFFSIR